MSYPCVHIPVTFVNTKACDKRSVFIDAQPYNVSDLIGDIRTNEFSKLKTRLNEVVANHDHQLFFHKDNLHCHRFDKSVL